MLRYLSLELLFNDGEIMKKLYAPWRDSYINNTAHKENKKRQHDSCPFCLQLQANNEGKHFILKRFTKCFVMMNLYPYSGGQLMVLPFEHEDSLIDLSRDVRAEIMEAVSVSIKVLQEELKPQGFNVGINLGGAGGGGIPTHLHVHVLPRWEGDTNFMPLLCGTKPVSTDLKKMYERLKKRFDVIEL